MVSTASVRSASATTRLTLLSKVSRRPPKSTSPSTSARTSPATSSCKPEKFPRPSKSPAKLRCCSREDASVGQVVNQKNVNDLPLNGRNFTFLAQLAAGVNQPQADTRGNAASGAFSANGLRPAQNNYMLDGIDNNSDTVDFLNGTNFVVLPPVDAVQEFKVQTSDFSAELGRSAGAVLNATIKSGTNQFHGTAWEFFRNDKLDAADYFEDAGGIPKGELRQNQFGVSAGGPIIKNKIFIFGDYEGFRRVQGTIQTGTVPTVRRSLQRLHQSLRSDQPNRRDRRLQHGGRPLRWLGSRDPGRNDS